jgi:hypothetical protein
VVVKIVLGAIATAPVLSPLSTSVSAGATAAW